MEGEDRPGGADSGLTNELRAALAAGYPDDFYRPHRVYIVQVEEPGMIPELSAGLLGSVADPAGAGVEIIAVDGELFPYQGAALEESLLLWAAEMEPEFEGARGFDFADPVTGPGFAPDHLVVDDLDERGKLLDYLRGGHPVLTTTATMNDILDPQAPDVVPTSFRTDGEWIWTDTVQYYLHHHGLAPDAALPAHIAAQADCGPLPPDTPQETAFPPSHLLL